MRHFLQTYSVNLIGKNTRTASNTSNIPHPLIVFDNQIHMLIIKFTTKIYVKI